MSKIRIRPGRRIKPPKRATETVFPDIAVEKDEPIQHPPAPLRIDRKDVQETIEEQRKGSARRLLKDRYVTDDGYLQSRTPFPLKAPNWEEIDQDRPEMTEDGALWEDIHHFVDFLTCRDVKLAYDLNTMIAEKPDKILKEFRTILQMVHQPLCKHEIMGRGYVFSKEPVLSPSQHIGQWVVEEQMDSLYKGMQYLWILDREFVEQQRNQLQGFDLERTYKSMFLLAKTFRVLHESYAWSEARYVNVLQELAIFHPGSAVHMGCISSPFVLANLLIEKRIMMRRLIDIQRLTEAEGVRMELLNEMGTFPRFYLQQDDTVFYRFIQWMPEFNSQGYSWMQSLRLCHVLFVVWQSIDIDIDILTHRTDRLQTELPKAFAHALEETIDQTEEEWTRSQLRSILTRCDEVVDKWKQLPGKYAELTEGLLGVLLSDTSSEILAANLGKLCDGLSAVDLYGSVSIEGLLKLHPEIASDPTQAIEIYNRVHPIAITALHTKERDAILTQYTTKELVAIVMKLDGVITELRSTKQPMAYERIEELIKKKAQCIRQWRRNDSVPTEIVPFLNAISVTDLSESILMDDQKWKEKEESLFLLFGPSPVSVLSNLERMPELLANDAVLERALSIARCRKITRKDLRNPHFRVADRQMSLLMKTLDLIRSREGTNEDEVIAYLEYLARDNLLDDVESGIDVIPLTQFCIICTEHPKAWSQFQQLLRRVQNPVLKAVRPGAVQKLKKEAFVFILKAPEIFLIAELWEQIVENMSQEQWTFAGLDVESVLDTEPCLFYYAVQDLWVGKYQRNAQKLIETPTETKTVRRRGKSVVDVEIENS